MVSSVIQLQCSCNNYPWGKKGNQSLAATLCAKTPGTNFKIDNEKEYSEMWMGDYPVQPAKDLKTGEELHKILDDNKEQLIGKNCLEKFDGALPFLPKILSIAKALPLQIHPDKDLATRLHHKDPEKFTDDNHKPEIAAALGKFEVFAGWKPNNDIQTLFNELEPLNIFLPDQHIHFNNETLKRICQYRLEAPDDVICETQEKLGKLPKKSYGHQSYILDLLPRLQSQYSKEDPGNLVALLTMNFLTLNAGDAIFVAADAPHAYLSGNIVECMARSNNVLNTGFCPRADRDSIELFTASLTFSPHNAEEVKLPSKKSVKGLMGKTLEYAPAMSEFNMLRTDLKAGEMEVIAKVDGPSVLFTTRGAGKMHVNGQGCDMKEGYVYFVGQGVEVAYDTDQELVVHRAYAE